MFASWTFLFFWLFATIINIGSTKISSLSYPYSSLSSSTYFILVIYNTISTVTEKNKYCRDYGDHNTKKFSSIACDMFICLHYYIMLYAVCALFHHHRRHHHHSSRHYLFFSYISMLAQNATKNSTLSSYIASIWYYMTMHRYIKW